MSQGLAVLYGLGFARLAYASQLQHAEIRQPGWLVNLAYNPSVPITPSALVWSSWWLAKACRDLS